MNCGLIIEMAADPDAGMETCPSPEIGDSRKRPLDSDTENGNSKRSHFSSGKCLILTSFHFDSNLSYRKSFTKKYEKKKKKSKQQIRSDNKTIIKIVNSLN